MKKTPRWLAVALTWLLLVGLAATASAQATGQNPLSSWNDVRVREAIMAFVQKVSDEKSADYVPPAERIAVFDNDGTLWAE